MVENLQILDPFNPNGLKFIKPKGIKTIVGMGIITKLKSLIEKKLEFDLLLQA